MYFQCHNYFNFFCASVLSDQAEKCRGSHFKKSLCHSSSDPTVSSYVSNLSYTFERTDRNNLCLAKQDCLCHAFIFSPKLCRVQLAVWAWFFSLWQMTQGQSKVRRFFFYHFWKEIKGVRLTVIFTPCERSVSVTCLLMLSFVKLQEFFLFKSGSGVLKIMAVCAA